MENESQKIELKDADVYMREGMDRYLNNDHFGGWFAESNAVSIVCYLSDKGDPFATDLKAVMLTKESVEQFKKIQAEVDTSLAQKRVSEKQLDQYVKRNYSNYIEWYGIQKADERKQELTTRKDSDQARYALAVKAYETELKRIKDSASKRFTDYMNLRGDAFADANEDPIVLLNKVIADVNEAYPEYTPAASDMNDQVKKLYGNYNSDLSHLNSVHELISDLSDNLVSTLEKKMNFIERQNEIQNYYQKQYKQQIFLVKVLIFFAIFAMIGFICLQYQWIPLPIFIGYLGVVFSIAFVVFFYYLWDFYMRDKTNFDEYQFNTYVPPTDGTVLKTFKDNIIYC
jgi:hypothetical protein